MNEAKVNARLLGVDPGEKRIGISISDPSGTIYSPLLVIQFYFLRSQCTADRQLCEEKGVGQIHYRCLL
jgi:putative Holliday junction resolvase